MDILAARRSIEQRLLKQSVALMSLVAVSGTIMGVITGSSAVLLDGIFSFIDVIIKIMMLMTAKLVARETSKRFQLDIGNLSSCARCGRIFYPIDCIIRID